MDYNKLMSEVKIECTKNNIPNIFIDLDNTEAMQLNYLFDRFLVFIDEFEEEQIKTIKNGKEMIKLYNLIYKLFFTNYSDHKVLDINGEKEKGYNKIFDEIQKRCEEDGVLNVFFNITKEEAVELNVLLSKFLVFYENLDDMEEYECGSKMTELYKHIKWLIA